MNNLRGRLGKQPTTEVGGGGTSGRGDELVEPTHLLGGFRDRSALRAVRGTQIGATMPKTLDLGIRRLFPAAIASLDRHRKNRVLVVSDLLGELATFRTVETPLASFRSGGQGGRW